MENNKVSIKNVSFAWLVLILVVVTFRLGNVVSVVTAQQSNQPLAEDNPKCGQPLEISGPLIDEAERKEFNTKWVEIAGNTYTRWREFGRRMAPGMNEGDIFTRAGLEASIKKISKMKTIYPISKENIEIRLDRADGTIDIVFCVKQKPKK